MQLSRFSRTKTLSPRAFNNQDLPEEDRFKIEVATLPNVDTFDLNAAQLEFQRLREEVDVEESDTADPNQLGKRLSIEDALKMQTATNDFMARAGKVLKPHVKVHNLNDNDGNPVGIEEIVSYPVFIELLLEIINFALAVSTIEESDEKN